MPPKAMPPPPPAADSDAAVSDEARDASPTENPIGVPQGGHDSAFREAEHALGDAVFSLMGVPFDKLEEQLLELK